MQTEQQWFTIGDHVAAKVIADSINQYGDRLTTLQLKFPRIILPEFNTHRKFSRNAASTRAIPTKKAIARLKNGEMFIPSKVGLNQPGMQADEEVSFEVKEKFLKEWVELGNHVADTVARWDEEYKIHKQVICRAIEPWTFSQVVMTSTEFSNFNVLRHHPAAEPHINDLAIVIEQARAASTPVIRVSVNDWHLPYVSDQEREHHPMEELLAFSTARCARVSYLLHDGQTPSTTKDIQLHEDLIGSEPLHASPAEHQAYPSPVKAVVKNFDGWVQYRAVVESNLWSSKI